MVEKIQYGKKTWREVEFRNVFPKRKTHRIIGMTFPRCDHNLGLEPSILNVLPQGSNVEYSVENRCFNDDDVEMYMCSVYISGYDEFKEWAIQHDRTKIVVGGYHPTTFPEDFVKYADKIVVGLCDDIWATIKQYGQTVMGVVNNHNMPRRDLYDMKLNQQIIPDKKPDDLVMSINTSTGCGMNPPCDFCCTPIMCPKLVSKPLEVVEDELDYMVRNYPDPVFLFIRDENFTMQKDWQKRLETIHGYLPHTKLYLFASANTLTESAIKTMAKFGVYMACLGLEDPTTEYKKNKTIDKNMKMMKANGVYTYLSFIVNPLKTIGREAGEAFYDILMKRIYELAPEMICGNFLMPFRGTKLWDDYYAYVSPDDYKYYNSKTPFLVRNPLVRQKMQFFMFWHQWQYFNSDFYNEKVRKFDVGDTLSVRFKELYDEFTPLYERIWDKRP